MSILNKISNQISQRPSPRLRQNGHKSATGFSLVELMVAMSVFLIVGGAAIALVRRHMPLFNTAQNQTNLNITLRNAVAQLQMEVVNAGTGFAGTTSTAFSPMGVTIHKSTSAACRTTGIYVAACFDSFTLISVDNNLPLLAPEGDPTKVPIPNADTSLDTSATPIYLVNPAGGSLAQYTAWAALIPHGTELMFVQGGTDAPAGQPLISIVTVDTATPNAAYIQLKTTSKTLAGVPCTNGTSGGAGKSNGIPDKTGDPLQDPLGIYDGGECARFTSSFNPALDYVVKLVNGATYSIDATTPANPKLVRQTAAGSDVIAEQIVGFTVGAWSSQNCPSPCGGVPTPGYAQNPGNYNSDWTSIRSLQVQLVARATPGTDNQTGFQNVYDGGNYQVQGVSVVINPRNLNSN